MAAVFSLLVALPLLAGSARPGWTKLEIVDVEHRKGSASDLARAYGAELVSDYGSFAIVYAPEEAVAGITSAARAQGLAVRKRDELDLLRLPGGDLDTRDRVVRTLAAEEILEYPQGKPGLFVLQMAGPPRPEWVTELQSMGWTLARYVPNNGYIAIGPPALRASTKQLPYVQWLEIFQPHQKNAFIKRDHVSRPLVFDLPTGPALEETIAAIQAEADGEVRVHRGAEDTWVYAAMPYGKAEKVLRQQLVIGVSGEMIAKLSDERQAMSLTSYLDSTKTRPTNESATKYWSWVTNEDRCLACGNMPSDQWKISIADTGLDDGIYQAGEGHPDFAGRVTKGRVFASNSTNCVDPCDFAYHGTMVASIAAGSGASDDPPSSNVPPGTGYRDRLNVEVDEPIDQSPGNFGWYLGTGVAPTAGLLVTKVFNSTHFQATRAQISQWIDDAVSEYDSNGNHSPRSPMVTVQNHSFEILVEDDPDNDDQNDPDPSGRYGYISREYDLRVRDANGPAAGRPEILISAAAGNYKDTPGGHRVATSAMAKNVLTVSGTEGWRQFALGTGWEGFVCTNGDGFRTMNANSRMGSFTPGYIKPDVVAPASHIVGAWSTALRQQDFKDALCPPYVRGYYEGDTYPDASDANKDEYGILPGGGTSFAAPVGAGAALIVKRYLGDRPEATSPALTKAMLIAGAQSIRGGVDKTSHPAFPGTTIGSVPSEQQGFGRLSFEDILTGVERPFTQDQHPELIFTGTGQTRAGRLRVKDGAKPVKVVLVWSDAAGNPTLSNPFVTPLVNDLDLEIRPSGTSNVYLGNRMSAEEISISYPAQGPLNPDDVNNVEYARFVLGTNQEFDVTVKSSNIAGDTDGNLSTFEQDFALVVLNADVVAPFVCPPPPKPSVRRRAVRHLRMPATSATPTRGVRTLDIENAVTILPGEAVTLEITPHTGVTYTWFKGNNYSDISTPIGSGPALTVSPDMTSTYWVMAISCPQGRANSDFFLVTVACTTSILTSPSPAAALMPSGGGSVQVSTSVVASGSGELHYEWRDAATNTIIGTDSPAFTWSQTVGANSPALYKDVYVRVTLQVGADPNARTCPVDSPTVRLALIPRTPQIIFAYTPGATIYKVSWPQKLSVVMDPAPSSPDHEYQYQWYRENGTPSGEHLSWFTDREISVTTDSIDTFWVKVTGTHKYGPGANDTYTEVSVSKKMYVELLNTCEMPPLSVTQNRVVAVDITEPVTFTAFCDWPGVEFTWYRGQSGDTRHPVSANAGAPHQYTVPIGTILPYWVRASLDCGAAQDSMTLTHTRGSCSPVLINQYVQSVEVAHGQTAFLEVDPVAGNVSYSWYQNEGTNNQVFDNDGTPIRLTREQARKSGRYWVIVESPGCANGAESYMATIRVASHPSLTPRSWPTEVWTGYGTSFTLDGTMTNATGYQWYEGEVGDESGLIAGAVSATYITPPLTANATYWVRVSAGQDDGTGVDSPTISVNVCQAPAPSDPPHYNTTAVSGGAALINVQMTGTNLQYQWYRGVKDDISNPIADNPFDILPVAQSVTTQYWVKVTAACGGGGQLPSWSSETFTVSVCPDFHGDETATAASTLVNSGATTTVSVQVTRGDFIEWYAKAGSGPAVKFAEGAQLYSVPTPPITQQTSFYAVARSGNCTRQSESVTVAVCGFPNIHWSSGPTQVVKGATFSLVASLAPNETANFGFYQETAPDTWWLAHVSSNVYTVHNLQATTRFKARATDQDTGCYDDTTIHTVNVCIPTIVTQPLSQTVNAGTTATLSMTTDLPGMQYQWYRGAVGVTTNPLTGHTVVGQTSTITVTPATDTTYWVRVTGCNGSGLTQVTRDSQAAVITVCQIPSIATQPASIWMTTSSTPLSVAASGTELTYQWYKGLSGDTSLPQSSTSASFTVSPSQTTNYWVRVSGRCGSPQNSTTAKVSVKPNIGGQPAGGPITKGTTRALTVAANGTELTYQWYQRPPSGSPVPVAGATGASYTPPPVMTDATYFARVYSGIAYDNSADATFTVCLPREINVVGYPSGHSGSQVVLQVQNAAAGETFEWYRGPAGNTSDPIGGGTEKYLNPQVTTQYWVRTKRTGCDADSAVVTINICYPKMNTEPEATSLIASGTTKTLTVDVTGTAPLVYQWYRGVSGDTSTPAGTNSNVFTTPALTASTTYWVRISTNAAACATKWINSQSATVNVCQPPVITAQPQANTVNKNLSYTISVTATGDNLHYQWYIGDSGVTTTPVGTDSDQLPVVAGTTKKYWVRVTGTCGVIDSIAALQSVRPIITSHPVDATVCGLGGMGTFTVTATGADAYTWYRYTSGVQDIVGTTRTITIPVPNASATFRVVVSSGAATATSVWVGVNIIPVPTVTSFTATQETSTRWVLSAPTPGGQGSIKYRFYEGALGDTSILLTDTTLSYYRVYPSSRPKTYWVRVYFTDTGCATDRAVTIP